MNKILYVLHSGATGGTFLTNKDLMKNVVSDFEVFLLGAENDYFRLYKYVNDELTVIKDYPRYINLNVPLNGSKKNYHRWSAQEFHNSWLSLIYFDILKNYDIDIVHIRHLINHSFDLPQIAKKLGIPVVLSIHDFYFICPFYVLLDENNNYCAGICSDNDENCYCPLKSLNDINSKEFIGEWRENVLKMFNNVDYFVTTSDIVKNLFLSIYPNESIINDYNFEVIEHGRDFPPIQKDYFEIPGKNMPVKILCPANHLNIMKGSEIIKQIKKEDKNNLIEFHFLGNCHDDVDKYGIAHGTFERDEFYKKVEEIQPSFIGIFSIWPETFCHTLTEAWSCNIPVIGTDIGVIEDRIRKNDGGWIISRDNPCEIFDLINSLTDNEKEYLDKVNHIKRFRLKTTEEMSRKYMQIYNSQKKNTEINYM